MEIKAIEMRSNSTHLEDQGSHFDQKSFMSLRSFNSFEFNSFSR